MPNSYKQNKTRHQSLRHILRTGLLFTALTGASISFAKTTSGIGPFVPNTELGFSPVAAAGEPRINWINGEYQETNKDLSVKVLGGSIDISRSWSQGRWWLNPAWAPLNFEIDPLGQDIKVIERVGTIYERSGQTHLYMASAKGRATVFIKKVYDAANQQTGWQWYDRLGNTIDYSLDGRIQSYADPSGVKVSFAYDSATSARILDHWGRTIYTVTMAGGLITKIDDLAGRSVRYQWQGNLLTQATDVMGNAWTYSYDANGQITGRTDPLGGQITAQYIQSFRAPESMLSLGKVGKTVDPTGTSGTTQKLANIWGGGRVGKFDGQGTCSSSGVNHYIREKRIFEVTWTDCRGNVTLYVYDLQGNELNRTFNGKQTARNQWDGKYTQRHTNARGLATTTYYDYNYQPLQITHPDGSVEKYSYEPQFGRQSSYTNQLGVVSTWSYDSKGNVTEWVEAKGLPEQRTTRYSYDQYSQLTSTTKGAGDASGADAITQSWKHDNSGNIVEFMDGEKNKFFEKYNSIGFLIEALDPDGGKKMYRHNNSGNITEILDSEKSIETIAYDALNRRIQTKSALGRVANIKYDASGGVSEFQNPYNVSDVGVVIEYNKHGQISKSISPSGYYVINSYDESGRLVSASDSVGNKLVYEYGVYGGENAGLLVAVHYPSYSELYKYDVLGRRVQVIDVFNENDKRVRSVQYNAIGERVAVTNSLGFVTLFGYDGLGRLTLTIGPSGGQSKYKYNINNQILNFIDGIGNKHDYFYNKTGQVVKTISPAGASSLFEYSKTGKLLFKKDADGNVKELRYDQFGDLIKEVYKNSESMVTQYIDYVNDLEGRIIQYEQKNYDGKLLSSAKYERNLQGEIIGSQINYGMVDDVGKIGFSFRSQYDEDGRLVKHIYPDASVQTYHYDGYNLSRLVTPAGETVSYDGYLNGKPGRVIMPGSEKSIEYDSVYRIKRISILSNGANLRQDEYLYDSADNIVRIKNKTGEVVYKYDSENRLIVAKPSAEMDGFGFEEEGYAYDAAGNRSFSLHQPGTWVYEGNHLVNYPRRDLIDKKTYEVKTAYDLRGNIKNEISSNDKLTFKYNEANRLINFENNKLNASYEYDPFGRRISKRVKNGNHIDVTYYLYHEYGLMAEFDSAGVMKKAYGWEGGVKNADWSTNPVWQAEVIDGDLKGKGTIYNYFHNNHLGAPLLAVDKEGHISWMATYEPFGSVKISNNSIEMNLRFPGQYWDKESDTHYNLYRNYSPQTGRYLQADPIGLKGGSNFYSYASSNPIMYYDPQGLESQPCCQPKMTEHDCCGTLPTTDDDLFNLPPIASGTVMCCQGKKIRCLSKSYDHARFGKEIKRKCAELHEDTHQNHVKECPNDCSYFINPIDVSKFTKETAECDAYGAEINCLLNRMPECGNDPTCIFALKRSIASSKDKMKEYKCSM